MVTCPCLRLTNEHLNGRCRKKIQYNKQQKKEDEEEFNAQNFVNKLLCVCRRKILLGLQDKHFGFRLGVS